MNQRLIKSIIINNLKCQIELHQCDGLVEMIEMDISFAYFGAWMKEIHIRHHVGPVGPTPGHVATCWQTGAHVSMTPHRSKETHLRPIRSQYVDPMAHLPTEIG
jgi:hypothetical protein